MPTSFKKNLPPTPPNPTTTQKGKTKTTTDQKIRGHRGMGLVGGGGGLGGKNNFTTLPLRKFLHKERNLGLGVQ